MLGKLYTVYVTTTEKGYCRTLKGAGKIKMIIGLEQLPIWFSQNAECYLI